MIGLAQALHQSGLEPITRDPVAESGPLLLLVGRRTGPISRIKSEIEGARRIQPLAPSLQGRGYPVCTGPSFRNRNRTRLKRDTEQQQR
jgi:hypothetical protein